MGISTKKEDFQNFLLKTRKTKNLHIHINPFKMSNEDDGQLTPLAADNSVMERVLMAKTGEPSRFASFWEMDENDVEEESMKEIMAHPHKKILWAAENGNTQLVKELLEIDGTLVNSRDNDDYSPLHRASYENHTETMECLLRHGADVNSKTVDGWTPLHSACHWGNVEAASLLLRCKADINARTNSSQTALHLASANKNSKSILELLLSQENIDISMENAMGDTALMICQRSNPFSYLFEMAQDHINRLSKR